jgi:hypothetical protein
MSRYLAIVGSLLLPQVFLAADNINLDAPATAPSYNPLRFEEDYSKLADEASRQDVFDDLRYIPLSKDSPDWYLSLGGELRERLEAIDHYNFGIQADLILSCCNALSCWRTFISAAMSEALSVAFPALSGEKASPYLQFKMTPLICYSRSLRQRLM